MRTVYWEDGVVKLIDQRRLPAVLEIVAYDDHKKIAGAIKDMVVRGAPAIGATAGFGLALAAFASKSTTKKDLLSDLQAASEELVSARPTAVNPGWVLTRILTRVAKSEMLDLMETRKLVLQEAQFIADEDVAINLEMAKHGSSLITDGDVIIHHCNTGSLATVDWGTALGAIRMAHEQGKKIHVLVDETRPRLQGSKLTAWELEQYGISYEIITDNMAGHFLRSGIANKVYYGADRVAANGDVANKIGTYMLSLAAKDNHVPVYPVVPTSTIDLTLRDGDQIPLEERDPREVLDLYFQGERVAPIEAKARNIAFDITPHRLITAIVTERGIIHPPFEENLAAVMRNE
jgi:methylthioribose-1-phosphate isomerase